eukprot:TRINITY_DN11699_c0_g1_i1.p1 TRINITY_DN11699_c0_g1~~TRINITY_DN11699_c0_g1_i1.p1  ORF type:complete len:235 (+),score=95.86 TRINITY_DN11699_c0_g1_i1:127-831(+)
MTADTLENAAPASSFGVAQDPLDTVRHHYGRIDFKALDAAGHNRCWKFLTHPEGWVDNIGVLVVVAAPIWLFSWVVQQGSLPSIFVMGTINIFSISASLLLIVPDSRKVSTYRTANNLRKLLNFDPRMTPNSPRHLFVLASLIFQLLVLAAVLMQEVQIVQQLLLSDAAPTPPRAPEASSDAYTPYLFSASSPLYKMAEYLSSSLVGNLLNLALTSFTAMFFGFSWFVGCFEGR